MAESDLTGGAAPGPGARSPKRVAQADARLPPLECRCDRTESRPASARGRAASDRPDDRSRHRTAAVDTAALVLHRRAVGVVATHVPALCRPSLLRARLSGVVCTVLCQYGFVPELAGRSSTHR